MEYELIQTSNKRKKLLDDINKFYLEHCKELQSYITTKIKHALIKNYNYAKIYKINIDEYEDIHFFNKKLILGQEKYYDGKSKILLNSERCKKLIDFLNELELKWKVLDFSSDDLYSVKYICVTSIHKLIK
jgi:hypothetical protein